MPEFLNLLNKYYDQNSVEKISKVYEYLKDLYQKEFEDDTAYLLSKYNDYVYPYRPEVTDKKMAYQPGIYVIKNDERNIKRL